MLRPGFISCGLREGGGWEGTQSTFGEKWDQVLSNSPVPRL